MWWGLSSGTLSLVRGQCVPTSLKSMVVFGVIAALCEEIVRYLGYEYMIKKNRKWKKALMYGIGWGGFESILIGFGILQMFVVLWIIKASGENMDTVELVNILKTGRWYTMLYPLIERVFAFILHIGLSVLVLQAFLKENKLYLVASIGFHFAGGLFPLLAGSYYGNPLLAEGLAGVFALLALYLVYHYKADEVDNDAAPLFEEEWEGKKQEKSEEEEREEGSQ